jgi:dynein heavy chain
LHKLPKRPLDLVFVLTKYPLVREKSMNSVLVQEIQRFSPLTALIRTSLEGLLQTIRGEQVASSASEELFYSVLHGEIPKAWLSLSYPSKRSLASYVTDLLLRLAAVEQWVARGPPPAFWLPGFFFPQSFLSAILQGYARRNALAIDHLELAFEFGDPLATEFSDPDDRARRSGKEAPANGEYVAGLFLEGAAWDQ